VSSGADFLRELTSYSRSTLSRVGASCIAEPGNCFNAKESFMSKLIQALIVTLMPVLVWAGPVDINTADAATIAKELQGIGLSRAQAIVAYREKNGAFRSADELRKIKGIGAKVLERNRANIKVDGKGEGAPRKKAE
jgi:competence protein ComEA